MQVYFENTRIPLDFLIPPSHLAFWPRHVCWAWLKKLRFWEWGKLSFVYTLIVLLWSLRTSPKCLWSLFSIFINWNNEIVKIMKWALINTFKLKEAWYPLPPWPLHVWHLHHTLLSSRGGAWALQAPCWRCRSRQAGALGRQGDTAKQ